MGSVVVQVGLLVLTGWGVGVIFPTVVSELLQGMLHWTKAGVAYCWLIQVGILSVLLSLRRFTRQLVPVGSPRFSTILILAVKAWIGWQLIRLLVAATDKFSFLMAGQWLLFLVQLYVFMEMVAPGSRPPSLPLPQPASVPAVQHSDTQRIRKGYPRWLGAVFWVLLCLLLDFVGCG